MLHHISLRVRLGETLEGWGTVMDYRKLIAEQHHAEFLAQQEG